jgi:hypothetical protein
MPAYDHVVRCCCWVAPSVQYTMYCCWSWALQAWHQCIAVATQPQQLKCTCTAHAPDMSSADAASAPAADPERLRCHVHSAKQHYPIVYPQQASRREVIRVAKDRAIQVAYQ